VIYCHIKSSVVIRVIQDVLVNFSTEELGHGSPILNAGLFKLF
jgi:hypothetical protein